MSDATRALPRVFLTFAGDDLPQVRPLAASLRSAVALDYAVPGEPFAAQRSDLIRASLALRLGRCAATLCLYGPGTLDDEWVRWTIATARDLESPLAGAPLEQPGPADVTGLLLELGAQIVPPCAEAVAGLVRSEPAPRLHEPVTVESLALTLSLIRQPV